MKTLKYMAVAAFFTVAAGCGARNPNAPARVNGTVRYNGQPVRAGIIIFHAKGTQFSSSISTDGSYGIFDLPAGDMVVTVDTESANPNTKLSGSEAKMILSQQEEYRRRFGKAGATQQPVGTNASPENYVKIPPKYKDAAKSPLKVSLGKGDNSEDFELKD